jgi:hypothetical protein
MTEGQASKNDEPKAVYEIRLHGTSSEALRRQFPAATVFTTRTETVLFRRVEEPAELDVLIEQLLSMGLVLTEVHEVKLPPASLLEAHASASEDEVLDDHDL